MGKGDEVVGVRIVVEVDEDLCRGRPWSGRVLPNKSPNNTHYKTSIQKRKTTFPPYKTNGCVLKKFILVNTCKMFKLQRVFF